MHQKITTPKPFKDFDRAILKEANLIKFERGVSNQVKVEGLWGRHYDFPQLGYDAKLYGGFDQQDAKLYAKWMKWVATVTNLPVVSAIFMDTTGDIETHVDSAIAVSAIVVALDCDATLGSIDSEPSQFSTDDIYALAINADHSMKATGQPHNQLLQFGFNVPYAELLESLK